MKALYKLFIVGLLVAMIATSCGGRKHDAAYYEQMVDSIRKAETLKDLQPKVAVNENPADAWFDTLGIHTLPIKTAGADLGRIGRFTDVPLTLNEYFGYPVSAKLKALALPKAWRRPVVMLAEMQDSITPVIYLYTMNKKHLPIDQLCIYERKPEDRRDDFGETYLEYYITSKYEITLMMFYQSHDKQKREELLNSRRYTINQDGKFEEIAIEL